ncbi:copper chaperone PCu(A)C [Amorphus sp. 3PC139-8]|uniref:copper chaperone PCu(A)C n=1 Tax=Amorphus sp. 3PC139-8 TaxID=2735676 RepID=UPI00345CF362
MRTTVLALVAAFSLSTALPALAHDFKVGTLQIEHPWTRATPPGAKTGAGFMVITNTGDAPDRLTGGTSPISTKMEVHTMTMDGGVMKMRQLTDGLEIPAGETVALKPGGNHMMFVGLDHAITEDEKVTATLDFEKAGKVDVTFAVTPPGAPGPKNGHGDMKMPKANQ